MQGEETKRVGIIWWFFCIAAGWWVLMGLVILLAAFDENKLEHERLLKRPDIIFGFSNKNVLLLAGGFHLVFGTLFLVIRDSFSKFLLMVWACSVCGIYRLGLNWLSPHWVKQGDVCPIERLSAGQLGINPKPFSLLWGVILVGMVVGALLVLLFERRQRKQREEAEFMENWRKTHNDGSQFPWAG
jgi:hypothetical protein